MISSNGTVEMLGTNACVVQMYFPTCENAHAQHSHANGGGEGSKAIFKNLQEVRTQSLIMCSSCNVFNCLLCIDRSGFEFLGGFFHHIVKENTNIKEGKTKMHALLQC